MDLAVSTQASPKMQERLAGIKLIALDLDGTTLTREGLTPSLPLRRTII